MDEVEINFSFASRHSERTRANFLKLLFWQEKEGQFPKNIIIACLVSVSDQFGAAVVLVVIKRVE